MIKQMFMILCDKCSCTGEALLLWELEKQAPTQANLGGQGRLRRKDLLGMSWKMNCSYPGKEEAEGVGNSVEGI